MLNLNRVKKSLSFRRKSEKKTGDTSHSPLPSAPEGVLPRVILATQPKSGTYLYAKILELIGFEFTFFHLSEKKLQAYDKNMLELGRRNPSAFDCRIPLHHSIKLVRTGQVAVSHLAPIKYVKSLLKKCKVLAVNRELRSSLTSYTRFLLESGRSVESNEVHDTLKRTGASGFIEVKGRDYIDQAVKIKEWVYEKNALALKYEDLHDDPDAQIHEIAAFLGIDQKGIPENVYTLALQSKTLTKSDKLIQVEWDESAEKEFVKLNGNEANKSIGYN